jgi:Xaa-Pro aminopeptidase
MSTRQPLRGFSADTFRSRRDRVLQALGKDALVLPGAPVRLASRDTEYRFRPDAELFYLTGVEEPEAVAVLRGHADEERFVLFVRPKDAKAELWNGPRLGPEEAKTLHGADAAYPLEEMEQRLPKLLEGAGRVFHRLDQDPRTEALVRGSLRHARMRGPRTGAGPRGIVDPGELLDDLRLIKDQEELDRMRRAAAVSARGVDAAARVGRPGVGEWEIEAAVDGAFRAAGSDGAGYPTIVASGANACVLHYVENSRRVGDKDLVLVDAGASKDLYCGDITRTFPASGSFTAEQRAVYEVVDKARAMAVAAVRPGVTVSDVHDVATRVLVDGLVSLGVLDGSSAQLIEEKKHEAFYPHKTSHWLGLDVHDPGDYARAGNARTLEPGMVLTVEPGLYFRAGEGTPERFAGIGVRVEDDVLVTASGHEVLTSELPTSADDVEAWVRNGGRGNGGR